MNEGALILSTEGFVLYANATFSNMMSVSLEELISTSNPATGEPEHRSVLEATMTGAAAGQATRRN